MNIDFKIKKLLKKLQRFLKIGKPQDGLSLLRKTKDEIRMDYQIRRIEAVLLIHVKNYEQAKKILITLNQEQPNQPDILNNLAITYEYTEDFETAIIYSKLSIEFSPLTIKYHLLLASIHALNNDVLNAIVTLKKAGLLFPNEHDVICDLAILQIGSGDASEAIEHLVKITKTYKSTLLLLDCFVKLNHYAQAVNWIPEVINKIDVKNVNLTLYFINMLNKLGKFKQAQVVLSKIEPINDANYFQAIIDSGSLPHSKLKLMAKKIDKSILSDDVRRNLQFGLSAKFFEKKDKENGFIHLHDANKLNELSLEDINDIDDSFKKVERAFGSNSIPAYEGFKTNLPIFIVGMPRSGTTLLENILSSHSEVFAAGETPYLRRGLNGRTNEKLRHATYNRYLDNIEEWNDSNFRAVANSYISSLRKYSKTESRIIDKMPHNFLYVGIIKKLFPSAKIIHIKRNPVACCFSIYKQNFHDFHCYASNMNYLSKYYKKYEKLMGFWSEVLPEGSLIEVDYENLVNNLEIETRRILNLCDLTFEDACLDFHKKKRAVSTASKKQVRNKLYKSSLQPWLGIEDEIKPLLDAFPEHV